MMAHNASALLRQKINAAYAEYLTGWLQMTPAELIERCTKITAVRQMKDELLSGIADEDAQYLLRFENPLEVVSDCRQLNLENGVIDEELRYMLWELRDRGNAEQDNPLDPEFMEQETKSAVEDLS